MQRWKLYIGLVHNPVLNQNNETITTSVTNLDIHDLARLALTYNLEKYFIIQPLQKQNSMINELLNYWTNGAGANYNKDRKKAILKVETVRSIEEVLDFVKAKENIIPKIIVTGAKKKNNTVSFKYLRDKINEGGVYLILFGTGWGLAEEIFKQANYILEPIQGLNEYNHLSVRSAASIIIDRICCEK
jgi:hypothetical protein